MRQLSLPLSPISVHRARSGAGASGPSRPRLVHLPIVAVRPRPSDDPPTHTRTSAHCARGGQGGALAVDVAAVELLVVVGVDGPLVQGAY